VTRGSSCPEDTASREPASTTDQQPALESAGLSGQVESGHPSLPSSREKVGGGTIISRERLVPFPLMGRSLLLRPLDNCVNGENDFCNDEASA